LRKDLNAAANAVSQDSSNHDFYALSERRQDELGDVMVSFNQMFEQIRQEMRDRQSTTLCQRTSRGDRCPSKFSRAASRAKTNQER